MSSRTNFYRELANEAKLRAAQAAGLSEKDKFEEVAMEFPRPATAAIFTSST